MFSSKRLSMWNRIRRCKNKQLRDFYSSQLPLLEKTVGEANYLALDLEMTGLSVQEHHVLSVGWVPISNREIDLRESRHLLLETSHEVGESATIHGIRDMDLSDAIPIEIALRDFLESAHGRILVFHHARLDTAFLSKLSQALYQTALKPFLADTMQLEHKRLLRREVPIKKGDLQLAACRRRYNLPDYRSHSALIDALSTAELFLAQTAGNDTKVRSVLS